TSAAKQGAGLVNVLNAVLTTTSIYPDHIDLLDTVNFKKTVKITLKNEGKHTETYTLSHIPADALNSYNASNSFPLGTPIVEADYATVKFSSGQVKIKAGQTAKITLTFKEPKNGKASQFPLYSGFVVATPKSKGGVAVHVPYTGVKGDVRNVPIEDTDLGFPALQVSDGNGGYKDIPADTTFDLTSPNATVPVVLSRLGSHTPNFTIRVFDSKNAFVGFLVSNDQGSAVGWRGRDSNVDENTGLLVFEPYTWQGGVIPTANATTPVTVPSGTYHIVLASQKKFSKGAYPADYEVFDLGRVTVKTA
ncbi:hypothetical protein BGX26_005549, partial [Mortierella sp. AD094]